MPDGENEVLSWLDGEILPLARARVSVEDRGFLFGDGVYEVVRVYGGQPFALAEHMARFASSAAMIALDLPHTPDEFMAIAGDLLARSRLKDAEIYFQLTRGVARRNHTFPADTPPTALLWVRTPRVISAELYLTGCDVITVPDERWARCQIKAIGLLPNVLAKEQARRQGAFEAVLIKEGRVTEGSSSNVLLVRDGRLVTPVADGRILPGITRAIVLSIARHLAFPVEERDVAAEELASADEVMLLGTMIEIMPVARVAGRAIGPSAPGPITRTLSVAFAERIAALAKPR